MKKYFLLGLVLLYITSFTSRGQDEDFAGEANSVKPGFARFPMDDLEHINIHTEGNLVGIWKMEEDSDPHNYFVLEKKNADVYALTYMARGGSNRTYENFGMFFSQVGDVTYINCMNPTIRGERGWFIMKVIDYDEWHITAAMVNDPTLKDLPNSAAVRERIAADLKDTTKIMKPVHFHKILPLMYCK